MRMRLHLHVFVVAFGLCLLPPARASGGGDPMDVFFNSRFADVPLSQHWQQPGGLHPGRHLPYLVLAYWRWGGAKPTPELGQAVDQLIGPLTPLAPEGDPARQIWPAAETWLRQRQDARRTLGLLPPAPAASFASAASAAQQADYDELSALAEGRVGSDYAAAISCYADTFDRARLTLAQRLAAHPQDRAGLAHWLAMQDWVFSQCSRPATTAAPELPPGAAAWVAQDHAWQRAAASFHAGELAEAEQAFRRIQADSASPWRHWAAYLRLRVMLRRGTEGVSAAEVESLAQQLLAEPALAALHPSVRRLRLTWQVRQLPPERRSLVLAQQLAQPGQPHETAARLLLLSDEWRSAWLMRRSLDTASGQDADAAERATLARAPDLYQWLHAVMVPPETPAARSAAGLAAWQQYQARHHPAWLLLAAQLLPPEHPAQAALAALPATHPAAYAARLEQARGAYARQDLQALAALSRDLLARPQAQASASEFNMVAALSLPAAADWAGWTRLALRRPAVRQDPDNAEPSGQAAASARQPVNELDHDVVRAINLSLPLPLWLDLAADARVGPLLRRSLLETGWTRAVLAQRHELARRFSSRLLTLGGDAATPLLQAAAKLPDEPAAWQRLLVQRLVSPRDTVGRAFLAVNQWIAPTLPLTELPLRDSPEAGTKWCALPAAERRDSLAQRPLLFSSPAQQQALAADLARWLALPSDSVWLSQQALALRGAHPQDPLVPEALAMAVHLSRYACASDEVARSARQAHALLQRAYGRTAAAKGAPYWYSGR
jgi:hypothetical protein